MNFYTETDKTIVSNADLLGDVTDLLSSGKKVVLRAVGDSMYPFIYGGKDDIIIAPVSHGDVQRGMIVLAAMPGGAYIVHRIMKVYGDGRVELMGDGNLQKREVCSRADVVGAVSHIVRNGRHIDCRRQSQIFKWRIWALLLPLRRYLLYISRKA